MYQVRGADVLNWGDYNGLLRALPPDFEDWRLTALWVGDTDLKPQELYLALDVRARLALPEDSPFLAVIDLALDRLEAAFPEVRPE